MRLGATRSGLHFSAKAPHQARQLAAGMGTAINSHQAELDDTADPPSLCYPYFKTTEPARSNRKDASSFISRPAEP
ncbi:hypothetical protein Acsp03_69030 [Actinomadura sp. NBRC 104412]|nr:hypothetical protein Acsp03_69030 [Actinomadura sp. NBRC 104412]